MGLGVFVPGPDITAAFASESQAWKAFGIWEGLAKASGGLEVGRSATTGPVESETWGGVSHKAPYRRVKGQEYIQNGWEPLLPTLQGIHKPAGTESKYNLASVNTKKR